MSGTEGHADAAPELAAAAAINGASPPEPAKKRRSGENKGELVDPSATDSGGAQPPSTGGAGDTQAILDGFKRLRDEQQAAASRGRDVEMDLSEHGTVAATLRQCDPQRTCYRLVDGALVKMKVGNVLPVMEKQIEMLTMTLAALKERVKTLGVELNEYKQKNNIRFITEQELAAEQEKLRESESAAAPSETSTSAKSNPGVLVPNG